jgi:hypothetical protein
MKRTAGIALLVVAIALGAGCDKGKSGGTALFKEENTAENLKGLVAAIVKAQEAGDLAVASDLMRTLVVDNDALKKIFKDDAPAAFVSAQAHRLTLFPTTDAELASLIHRSNPNRTQINVHGATSEEIAAGTSEAAKEFSAMPRDFAANLRPAMKFYEVEFVEPGKEAGVKYHMFFWDGARWRMLGPGWR